MRQGASEEGMAIIDYCDALLQDAPLKTPVKLSAKQRKSLAEYLEIIQSLRDNFASGSLKELVMYTITKTDYISYLREDKESFEERESNLNALVSKAAEWESSLSDPTLASFLEELSLKSNLDEADSNKERVHLMSIHNSKGLEYELVFLVGLEETLFPHINAMDDNAKIEEERRLCYVGITRAKEFLYLSNARQRMLWGASRRHEPSRFLNELPRNKIEIVRKVNANAVNSHQELVQALPQNQTTYEDIEPDIDEGQLVSHSIFGVGVVQQVTPNSMGNLYKVLFTKDNKVRSLIGKLAKLKKL